MYGMYACMHAGLYVRVYVCTVACMHVYTVSCEHWCTCMYGIQIDLRQQADVFETELHLTAR